MTLRSILAAASVFALAACNPPQAPEEAAAPAAPAALMDQALAMQPDQQPVFAWQQLTTYQAAHPEFEPVCNSIRAAESRGVIPEDVDPESVYGAHVGSLVYSIQCGPQLTGTRFDPREHWLVVFAPGAMEPLVVRCADARGQDICPATMPRVEAAAP